MDKKYFILRMGSNNEKIYVYKTLSFFSGILAKANYFESSKGFLSALFLKINSIKKMEEKSFFIIDPVTYVYGLNPRNDWSILSWIKVPKDKAEKEIREGLRIPQKEKISKDLIRPIENPSGSQVGKVEVLVPNRAYRKIADEYFFGIDKIKNTIGKRAILASDFDDQNLRKFVQNVIEYQLNALESYYLSPKYENFQIPKPLFILSPYFTVNNLEILELMFKIWSEFENLYTEPNSGLVLLSSIDFIKNNFDKLVAFFSKTNSRNIFFWFDDFNEDKIGIFDIEAYLKFIAALNQSGKNLFNFYSGGFSPLLLPYGLTGLINGPGYGLSRKIEPVRGGIPSAQYYIPGLRFREPVLGAYDLIVRNNLGKNKKQFHREICNCAICKFGIIEGAEDMPGYYDVRGEERLGRDGKRRRFPTKEALERVTYHFILSRLIDFKWASKASKIDVLSQLERDISMWHKNNDVLRMWFSVMKSRQN